MTSRAHRGFTLIEAIMVMVITGIVAGIVATFIARPIQGYLDTTRRAAMSDVADTALRRIGFELRAAVPNSVRVDANRFLEFVPASTGGRYRAQLTGAGAGDILDGTSAADTTFDVLGPAVTAAAGDFIVVFNTGQVGLDVYAGNNRRTLPVAAAAATTVTFTPVAGSPFPPFESPDQRFQLVPATGPVTFACTGVGTSAGNGTGELRRHTAYGFNAIQATAGLGAGALLANGISACNISYAAVSASNGLVILRLGITRENETVSLVHEIHVDNTP